MTATDVEMADSSAPPPTVDQPLFPTVRILELVTNARLQHGIRHQDYQRYRKHCAAKLFRLRKAANFQNSHKGKIRHKAKFVKKWLTDDTFNDERLMQIGIFEAERWWAQAMAEKQEVETNPELSRKKFSIRMNLKRAVVHAKHFEALISASSRCDAPTKIEAQAYYSWLEGICSFEMKNWRHAAEALKAARTLYDGLAEATPNTSLVNIYTTQSRQLKPQIRLCEVNIDDSVDASVNELMALRIQLGGGEGLDNLIAEMRAKASSNDAIVVEWAQERSTVEEDMVKQVIQGWNQVENELKQCGNAKEKMALYEKQLMDTRDAIDKVNDLIRRRSSSNTDASALITIKSYLEFLKISGTAARYLAIIENSKVEKKAKPQDLLRLYDSVIENLKEVLKLPKVEANPDIVLAFEGKIAFYKAFRCHHMAVAYAAQGKYPEAQALFERASWRKTEAEKLMKNLKDNKYFKELPEDLAELGKLIGKDRESTRAKQLLELDGSGETSQGLDEKIVLSENLDKWLISGIQYNMRNKKPISVAPLPPRFEPMPNKPLFFDLALNHIRMPMEALQQRLEKANEGAKPQPKKEKSGKKAAGAAAETAAGQDEQQGGLGNMVKGWFWGNR